MRKNFLYFIIFLILLMLSSFKVYASSGIVIKDVVPIYNEESDVHYLNDGKVPKVLFNKIGQSFQYKIIIENKTDSDLNVNNYHVTSSSKKFMKYEVNQLSSDDVLKSGDTKEILLNMTVLSDKGFARNFLDEVSLNVNFSNVDNPDTNDIFYLILFGLFITFLILSILFFSKYIKFISLILLIVSFIPVVKADYYFNINFDTIVEFKSPNVLKETGIYYVNEGTSITVENHLTRFSDKTHSIKQDKIVDLWLYASDIKHIEIKNELVEVKEYAYKFDVSLNNDERVMAYLIETDDEFYDCIIMADGIIYANSNSIGLFAYMENLEEIENIEGIDFSEAESLAVLFYKCYKLKEIDLSSFETSNVIDMSNMFGNVDSVKELDLSYLETDSLKDMYKMFASMDGVTYLDLSSFETNKVENMHGTFGNMSLLEKLDISNFNTSNVVDMATMFADSSSLKKLDLSSFDTSNVRNMRLMFSSYSRKSFLEEIIGLDKFNTSKVTDMSYMFQNCEKLKEVNVSNFDTSSVLYMDNMFTNVMSVKSIDVSNFDTSNVKTMSGMFKLMYNLEYLDISNFDYSSVTNCDMLFTKAGMNVDDFVLDISGVNIGELESYMKNSLFQNNLSTHKIYVKDESSKEWLISKNFSNITSKNIIIGSCDNAVCKEK